jgi:hypothetical protein
MQEDFFRLFCGSGRSRPFSLGAGAQTGGDRSSLGKTVPGDLSTQVSDETFLAAIKARDDKLALVAELRQIKSYHDKLKSGLGSLFSSLPISSRETYFKIADELDRLKQFENNINSAPDVKTKDDLAKKFDGDYPVVLNEDKVARLSNRRPTPTRLSSPAENVQTRVMYFRILSHLKTNSFLMAIKKYFP